jgi:hypothetical protein
VVKKSDQKDAEMAFAIMTDHADCLERELTIVTAQWDRALEDLAGLRASVLDLSHPNIKMILSERDEAREQLAAARAEIDEIHATGGCSFIELRKVTEQRDRLAVALERLERLEKTAGGRTWWDDPARVQARKTLQSLTPNAKQ